MHVNGRKSVPHPPPPPYVPYNAHMPYARKEMLNMCPKETMNIIMLLLPVGKSLGVLRIILAKPRQPLQPFRNNQKSESEMGICTSRKPPLICCLLLLKSFLSARIPAPDKNSTDNKTCIGSIIFSITDPTGYGYSKSRHLALGFLSTKNKQKAPKSELVAPSYPRGLPRTCLGELAAFVKFWIDPHQIQPKGSKMRSKQPNRLWFFKK